MNSPKNWKTLLAGLITGIPPLLDALLTAYHAGYFTDKSGTQLAMGVGLILLGVLAKDHNVTGGTVVNSPNDASEVKKATKEDVK